MNTQFLEAVFTDGIQHPNFFNGRILTASDLRDEQTANLRRSRYLGQAIGAGVVYGLQVSAGSGQTSLSITRGLAINRRGDGLHLPNTITVELVLTEPLSAPKSPFIPCDVAGASTLTSSVSTSYYLLSMTSTTRLSVTMAPNSGLDGDSPGCTNRYEEMGVQFKLVSLTNDDFISPIPAIAPDSRSRLAHVCLGTNQLRAASAQPQQQSTTYGLVDSLYQDKRLTDCDVPLAVFRFQASALQFVDMWAVRRLVVPGTHWDAYLQDPFSSYITPRRAAEAAAFLLQFQNHLEDLRNTSSIDPATVVAKDYFEYLPAAGYLPIQSEINARRFQVNSFFGTQLTAQVLGPEQLRTVFKDSFYAEPLRPGVDEVDIYQVVGTPALDPYRIFVRRTPIVLPELDTEDEDEAPTTVATGNLYVAVLSATGEEILPEYILSVVATHQETGQSYTAKRVGRVPFKSFSQNAYKAFLKRAKTETNLKYAPLEITAISSRNRLDDIAIAATNPRPYVFINLPAGTYTVKAIPTLPRTYGIAKKVTVKASINNFANVTVRTYSIQLPDDILVKDDYLTLDGIILDGYYVDPRWPEYYPNWGEDILGPNVGVVNPPPEDWIKREDLGVGLQLEELLERKGVNDPRVATEDAIVYVRKGYNPTQPSDTVTAFVQTQDGRRFPAIPLAADNALDKAATVDRTEISDFDRATVDQLGSVGLAGVDAIASAPTKLLAGVLGQSVEYSASLIADAQTTLQEDFRDGYLGYAGITKAQSDALKNTFGDKVELANASSEQITRILGEASSGFINRFLSDVSNAVSTSAISLGAIGISETGQANLADIGVTSNKAFRDLGTTEAGRDQLRDTLEITDTTLDRYLETAAINYAQGQLVTAPEKSIGTLITIPADLKGDLVNAGIGSAKELANANPDNLATTIGISAGETAAIIDAAVPYSSGANITLVQGALKSNVDTGIIQNAGLTSARAISRADAERVASTDLDQAAIPNLRKLGEQLLAREQLFRRF